MPYGKAPFNVAVIHGGGVRVIYYWAVTQGRILMLFAYPKSERDDLTQKQLKILREIIEREYP